MIQSVFGDIPGMGSTRVARLLDAFDGPEAIARLTPEVIQGETGIPIRIGTKIIKIAKSFSH